MADQTSYRQQNTSQDPEDSLQTRNIDLDTIIRDLLRQWLMIVLAGVIAAALYGTYLNIRYTPTYKSETTFFVGENGVNTAFASRNLQEAETMTANLEAIVNSEILSDQVAAVLGRDSLNATIAISSVPSTNLMKISVEAASPKECYEIIHKVEEQSLAICRELNNNIRILTLQDASIPVKASNPLHLRKGMVKAGTVGIIAMIVLLALLAYARDTVKNESYFGNQVDAKRIATIAHERKIKTVKGLLKKSLLKKNAFSLLLTNPALSFRFSEANKLMATNVYLEMKKYNAKSIMITSYTENEGKSTVAANLALSLAQAGYKVCLLDCDFRKPAQYKIFQAGKERFANADLGALLKGNNSMKLVPLVENTTLYGMLTFESQQALSKRTQRILGELMKQLDNVVDIIVIDSAPWGLVAEGINIARIADTALLVVEQDYVAVRSINDTIDQLRETTGGFIGCVFNNVSRAIAGSSHYGYGGYYGYGAYHHYEKQAKAAEGSQTKAEETNTNNARTNSQESLEAYEKALRDILAKDSIKTARDEDTSVRIEQAKGGED